MKTTQGHICPTSVVNVFCAGIAMASNKVQWTNGQIKMSVSAVKRNCI